jgi:prevent-host-death family protein
MKTASVTEVKNNLSRFLELVRNGETVVITEHGIPVARIESIRAERNETAEQAKLSRLERAGVLRRGRGISKKTLSMPLAAVKKKANAVAVVIEERREGR